MNLLAIDTVSDACSAALCINGEVREIFEKGSNHHSARLLPMVDKLLADGGIALTSLDAIAFDIGPGSFTGVRIGAGVAQGLAFSADLPLIGVSSLEVLVYGLDDGLYLPAIDARMGQVYWNVVSVTGIGVSALQKERVDNPDKVTVPQQAIGIGSGWDVYGDQLSTAHNAWLKDVLPRAENLGRLASHRFDSRAAADTPMPLYVRNDVARKTTSTERQRWRGRPDLHR